MYPISAEVRKGDRRLGAAVEPPEEGEAPGEAPSEPAREAPGEGPPGCTGVISREPSVAAREVPASVSNGMISREPGECGVSEPAAPYMFEQDLATCEAKENGNQWFSKELTVVVE